MNPKIKKLHERAAFFKRLAVGAGHRKFAVKMKALADEYEREAAQVAAAMDLPAERHDGVSGIPAGQIVPQAREASRVAKAAAYAAGASG